MLAPHDDSFTYNGTDVYDIARLRVVSYDVFTAPLRARKVVVPLRSGAYDYGAKHHEERSLRIACTVDGEITPAQFDSLKYLLSRKGRIILWDKPDRYYYGRAYNAPEVLDAFMQVMRDFELVFTCDPYAYALEPTVLLTEMDSIDMQGNPYPGTRRTPTRITIYNDAATPMQGIRITAREAE